MGSLEFTVRRNEFHKLPHILKEIQKMFGSDKNINGAILSILAEVLVKSCGIKVGNKVDPDAASRGKLVTLFKKMGVDLSRAARDTTYFANISKSIDPKEFSEGLNIQIYPERNRIRFAVNIIHERFMGRLDQNRSNPAAAHVSKKIDELVKKEK